MADDHQQLPQWLAWAREIQALSQTGLTFTTNEFDRQRFERLREIAAEILAKQVDLPPEFWSQQFAIQTGYATPKIDVRGAVVRDGKILLVQEKSDQRWCMPGGWGDVGEKPSAMVAREVLEESGFAVIPRKVAGVFDANRDGRPMSFFHAYKVIFLCEITGGTARPSEETLAVDFFAFDQLPPLSTSRTHPRHLAEIRLHLADTSRPAAFD
jgi:ADP-ribose pyrophosphatase YjhB (NUDIX family)